MIVDIIRPRELSSDHAERWDSLQQKNRLLSSPFLSAAFTQAVDRHRDDIRVAVVREEQQVCGFFSFQVDKQGTGRPVAHRLNDFQAIICEHGVELDVRELLHRCGLQRWHFDHLLVDQHWLQGFHALRGISPYVDTSQGFEAYVAQPTVRSRVKDAAMKSRRLERAVGPVRFEFRSSLSQVFASLVEWKSQQIHEQKARNVLEWDWVIDLLDDLRQSREETCRGILSALYAGDELVAVHLGIHNRQTLHWWFTTYSPDYSRFSPGNILLLKTVEEAAACGITRVDLGKGEEQYKRRLQSGATEVAEGVLTSSSWDSLVHRASYRLRALTRSGAMQQPVRSVKRFYERLTGQTDR